MGHATDRSARSRSSESGAGSNTRSEVLPAPLLRLLQERFGNTVLVDAMAGGGEALGELIAAVLEACGTGGEGLGAEMLSNQAVQDFLGARQADSATHSKGDPLPAQAAAKYGTAFGVDLSGVRLHTDAAAADAAAERGAAAFACGTDLFFARGRSPDGSPESETLLAHELAHVAQHAEGRLAGEAAQLEVPTASDSIEQEADARAATADPAQSPEDEGWLMAQVREISPTLAAVLSNGVEATLGDDLLTIVGDWVASQVPDVDLPAMASAFTVGLGEALGLLAGAAQGDIACCEKLSELAHSLTNLVTDWSKAEGGLFQIRDAIEGLGQWALTAYAGIMQHFLDQGAALATALGMDQMAANIEAWLIEKGAVLAAAVDQGLAWMALPSLSELPAWLVGKLGALVAGAADLGSGALDLFAQGAMLIPGMELLASIGDNLVLAGEAPAWMAANWGNPEIWETEGEALREHYGGLAGAMQLAMETWGAISSGVSAVAGGVDTVRGYLEPLATNPLFLATLLIPGLNCVSAVPHGVRPFLMVRSPFPILGCRCALP